MISQDTELGGLCMRAFVAGSLASNQLSIGGLLHFFASTGPNKNIFV
jgi:hypothetical protein